MHIQSFPTRIWRLAHGRSLELGTRTAVMGILNVTPDSFSDGGAYAGSIEAAVARAEAMMAQGADIIDIGGESTRPGAVAVSAAEEQRRVLPVIEALASMKDVLISVDTYRAETANLAIRAGAHIVNDVWGAQREPDIARVAAETGAGLCLMHTGREREKQADVIKDQLAFLRHSLAIVAEAGVMAEAIVLDPGFGFAKDVSENVELMVRLPELLALGHPLLVGTSRKRFLRALAGREDLWLDIATATTSALLRERGASIVRVHDVAASREALSVIDAMLSARDGGQPA
ncbi:dihydropteroate synthase [Aureimonas mangrovi]|uniref:dihydropteroate synthase n=1 Tax=Aureimonas mangrovi TaxID=2758041 RepID=UPI00163D4B09|nr:dihydropteroate synthase [Aureimonas mangrovi]